MFWRLISSNFSLFPSANCLQLYLCIGALVSAKGINWAHTELSCNFSLFCHNVNFLSDHLLIAKTISCIWMSFPSIDKLSNNSWFLSPFQLTLIILTSKKSFYEWQVQPEIDVTRWFMCNWKLVIKELSQNMGLFWKGFRGSPAFQLIFAWAHQKQIQT